ncbi:MAG: hypothetical protein AMXMBFR82_23500 [Candidatus Hydrogenedentota bacterium]
MTIGKISRIAGVVLLALGCATIDPTSAAAASNETNALEPYETETPPGTVAPPKTTIPRRPYRPDGVVELPEDRPGIMEYLEAQEKARQEQERQQYELDRMRVETELLKELNIYNANEKGVSSSSQSSNPSGAALSTVSPSPGQRPSASPSGPPVSGQEGWAVIVGVSKYQKSALDLTYAASDAQQLYRWLISPAGGNYDAERVTLLLDEHATKAEISQAIRGLEKALPEDIVVFFFSGHGAPLDDTSDILYFLPYEADNENLAETGYKMRTLLGDLQDNVKAEKLIVVADACHSGGIGKLRGDPRAIVVEKVQKEMTKKVNDGMHELLRGEDRAETPSLDGTVMFTASNAEEVSREAADWGGGVFTHAMLRGLTGKADQDANGHVTVGELSAYVSREVREATNDAQVPRLSGDADAEFIDRVTVRLIDE